MKYLGNSLHIANSGKLIARSSKTPTAGGIVFDSNKNKYCIYGIDTSAINNTINLNCVDSSQRLKQINNYSNNYGQFSVDVNSTKYG